MSGPTIGQVLSEFLEEQKTSLAPKTYARYREVIELFQHSIDTYAYQYLNEADSRRFESLAHGQGARNLVFCDIFGPEHILGNVNEFLGYFMVRKVAAGPTLGQAAGTVTKKLATWLAEKGYVRPQSAKVAAERGASAASNLPKAARLEAALERVVDSVDPGACTEEVEDHFTITRVEANSIWLEGMLDGRELGPIRLPPEVARRCTEGWTISGVVGRVRRRWELADIWHVYPE
ncbi:MAG TPA: hypothetical protein VII06_43440 [Chloroflexota bacterium]|jgi:hypothetical protein